MSKYNLKVQCTFGASVTAYKNDQEYFEYDATIPNKYMENCRQMIVDEIFEYSLSNYIDPHRNFKIDSSYKNGTIIVNIEYEGLYNKKQIKKIVEEIEDAIDLGADTWAEGDLVLVDNKKCQDYDLGQLDDNVYLDIFFQRIGEVEVFKKNPKPDWIKKRCVVHLVNITKNEFTPSQIKHTSIYDKLIKQMKRGDIVNNVNGRIKSIKLNRVLFFDGKNIIKPGKNIDTCNIPEEFDILEEFYPGYWDLNSEDTRNGENQPFNINSLVKNKKSNFNWNDSNYIYGSVDISKHEHQKDDWNGIKYLSFKCRSNDVMLFYSEKDMIEDLTKIDAKSVEKYDCKELYKEFKRHVLEDMDSFQRLIQKINAEYDYVLVAK